MSAHDRDPLAWIDDELATLDACCLRRHLAVRRGPQSAAQIQLDGDQLINFSSNDYLGLAAEALSGSVQEGIEQAGWGAGASPLVTGRGHWHARLEQRLAEFEGTESALLFPSGFAANMGSISALVGPGDAIFSDAKNHASIIDGCRLSGATVHVYPHCDADALTELVQQAGEYRRRLIVTDGLFSMDGDLAPLPELVHVAQQYGAMLMVDEAHATGVFGRRGRGVAEYLQVEAAVHVRVGTLSKALGSIGGFVVGQQRLIQWLANRARSYVFSTASPEAVAIAGLRALEIVQQQPQRRELLLAKAARLRDALHRDGWKTGNSTSQIVPVIIGEAAQTMRLSACLRERGFLVPGIRPPSVPPHESLLRISLSYEHTDAMIDQLVEALASLRNI